MVLRELTLTAALALAAPLSLDGCAGQHAGPGAPPAGANAEARRPSACACHVLALRGLDAVVGHATASASLFLPDLLDVARASERDVAPVAFDALAGALFPDALPSESEPNPAGICLDRLASPDTEAPPSIPVKPPNVRIYDVRRASFETGEHALLVLFQRTPPRNSDSMMTEWHVALFDAALSRLAETSFATRIPFLSTYETTDTSLAVRDGKLLARVVQAHECGAEKDAVHFDIPIDVSLAAPSLVAHEPLAPATPSCACRCRPVSFRLEPAAAPTRYRASQGKVLAERAMPYVAETAALTGFDLTAVARTLVPPPRPLAPEELPDERLDLHGPHVMVGSLDHTRADWTYVFGDTLRIHQLLAVRDDAGQRRHLVLYARYSPDELLYQRTMAEWRLALVVGTNVLSDVPFYTRIPHSAPDTWSALQTRLALEAGQPVVSVRYLASAPRPVLGKDQMAEEFVARFALGTDCVALSSVALVRDDYRPPSSPP